MTKFRMVLLVLITVLLLIIAAGIFLLFAYGLPNEGESRLGGSASAKGPDAVQVRELTWTSPEIKTNLQSGNLVLVQYAFQVENKKAVEELELRSHQVNDAIISLLQGQTKEDLLKSDGSQKLRTQLQNRLNQFMQEGKVVEVYTVQQIVQ